MTTALQEALLAALTHLACSAAVCYAIHQRRFPLLLAILRSAAGTGGGIACNALALVGALAAHAALHQAMIAADVLHVLFHLRDHPASGGAQRDAALNARFCLERLGYGVDDPSPLVLEGAAGAGGDGLPAWSVRAGHARGEEHTG